MRERCLACNGLGYIINKKTCPTCHGLGYTTLSLGEGSHKDKQEKCPTCKGKGYIEEKNTCLACDNGWIYYCDLCGKKLPNGKTNLCEDCDEDPFVIKLKDPVDEKFLRGKHALLGRVKEITKDGKIIVALTDNPNNPILGEIKRGNRKQIERLKIGDQVYVRILDPKQKPPFDLYLIYWTNPEKRPRVVVKRREYKPIPLRIIHRNPKVGSLVRVKGVVSEIHQTSNGPTQFIINDEEGNSITVIAFAGAGVRAYPEIRQGDPVDIYGYVNIHRDTVQIDSIEITKLRGEEASRILENTTKALEAKAQIPADYEFTVKSPIYDGLREEFVKAAQRIRKAVLTNQRIFIRYHAPCVDGLSGALSMIRSIEGLFYKYGKTNDEVRKLLRRYATKSPYYDLSDAIRDLSVAIDEKERFGLELPLIILIDLGSSNESLASYKLLSEGYGIDFIIIDHHVASEEVKQIVHSYINPMILPEYKEKYSVSAGMLAYELGKMINPFPRIWENSYQLPAISGIADKVKGEEFEEYKKLANEIGYDEERLNKLNLVVDYLLYYNRYADAISVLFSLTGMKTNNSQNVDNICELIYPFAKSELDTSVEAAKENSEKEEKEKFVYYKLDLDSFSAWQKYPNTGRLIGKLHDWAVENEEKPVLTLGIGNDYAIFRGDNITIDFTEMIKEILEELPAAMIDGGGHVHAGTVRYLPGYKDTVINKILEKIEKAMA